MKIPTFVLLVNAQADITETADGDNNKSKSTTSEYPQSNLVTNSNPLTNSEPALK